LKWHLQSPFLLLHSASIDLQDTKDSIDEEDPRPTSYTWSYIRMVVGVGLGKGGNIRRRWPLMRFEEGHVEYWMDF